MIYPTQREGLCVESELHLKRLTDGELVYLAEEVFSGNDVANVPKCKHLAELMCEEVCIRFCDDWVIYRVCDYVQSECARRWLTEHRGDNDEESL